MLTLSKQYSWSSYFDNVNNNNILVNEHAQSILNISSVADDRISKIDQLTKAKGESIIMFHYFEFIVCHCASWRLILSLAKGTKRMTHTRELVFFQTDFFQTVAKTVRKWRHSRIKTFLSHEFNFTKFPFIQRLLCRQCETNTWPALPAMWTKHRWNRYGAAGCSRSTNQYNKTQVSYHE